MNPFSDWGFKRIFGQEASKRLLLKFLNVLLEGERRITDLTFLDKEQTPLAIDMKGVIYDIYCKTDTGERIIVEMQNCYQRDLFMRAFYYESYSIVNQVYKGKKGYDFSNVYVVCFMNFMMSGDKLKRFRTDFKMTDTLDHGNTLDYTHQIYLMLPLFTKELDECETNFDKWIYALKHMETSSFAAFLQRYPEFQELADRADPKLFTIDELDKYVMSRKILMDNYSVYKSAVELGEARGMAQGMEKGMAQGLEKGMEKGMAQGMAQGEAKANVKNARAMKAKGLSLELIAEITSLPLEEIEKL